MIIVVALSRRIGAVRHVGIVIHECTTHGYGTVRIYPVDHAGEYHADMHGRFLGRHERRIVVDGPDSGRREVSADTYILRRTPLVVDVDRLVKNRTTGIREGFPFETSRVDEGTILKFDFREELPILVKPLGDKQR